MVDLLEFAHASIRRARTSKESGGIPPGDKGARSNTMRWSPARNVVSAGTTLRGHHYLLPFPCGCCLLHVGSTRQLLQSRLDLGA